MKPLIVCGIVVLTCVASANDLGSSKATNAIQEARKKLAVPSSIVAEHHELHATLEHLTTGSGKTAEAARAVAKVLQPHFEKEEQVALPPLGLLAQVSSGTVTRQMEYVIPLTDKLKTALPEMLKEHKAIAKELDKLHTAATTENNMEAIEFAAHLKQHVETEEQILYPAAVLVGQVIKEKLSH